MTDLPAWCRTPAPLVERDVPLEIAVRASMSGPVTLVGRAGVGATSMGAALLRALRERGEVTRLLAVRVFHGMSAIDLAREIGLALDLWPPADLGAIAEELDTGPPTAILVDDADLSPSALGPLVDLRARWVLVAHRPLVGASVQVQPLSTAAIRQLFPQLADPAVYEGLPGAAILGGGRAGRPFAAVDRLPPGAEMEVAIPGGARHGYGIRLPDEFCVPSASRWEARRSVREALDVEEPGPESLTAVLRGRLPAALALASGRPVDADPADLWFYDLASRRVPDADLAAIARTATARLRLRHGEAREVCDDLARPQPISPRAASVAGWLAFAWGDAAVECGRWHEAEAAYERASAAFSGGDDPRMAWLVARSAAARWASVGRDAVARRWLARSRSPEALTRDPEGWGEGLRVAGDLAVASGEWRSAEALYHEAVAFSSEGTRGTALRRRVQARLGHLALVRGGPVGAGPAVDPAGREADPAQDADHQLLCARVAARRGQHEPAVSAANVALAGYARWGRRAGVVACRRLLGDLAALRGDRLSASLSWRAALRECAVRRDVRAAEGLLTRLSWLEDEPARRAEIDRLIALADALPDV